MQVKGFFTNDWGQSRNGKSDPTCHSVNCLNDLVNLNESAELYMIN